MRFNPQAALFASLAMMISAPVMLSAGAQTALGVDGGRLEGLAASLSDGLSCSGAGPGDVLEDRAKKSGAAPADLGVALALISSNSDLCPPIRTAASALAGEYSTQQAQALADAQKAKADEAARAVLSADEIEAQVAAASTKFEIGPPPRNLTRGRAAGP